MTLIVLVMKEDIRHQCLPQVNSYYDVFVNFPFFLLGVGGNFYCISSDYSDLPDTTDQYIELSVIRYSTIYISSLYLTYIYIYILMRYPPYIDEIPSLCK